MKIWKQGIIGILAIMVLAFAIAACDDGKKDELCTCNPKEHYLPCTCGGSDCTCAVIPRGYADTGKQVPIWQKSDDPAVVAVAGEVASSIATCYGYDSALLDGKIKEIWIIKEAVDQQRYFDYETVGGKTIIKIQYNSPYIANTLDWAAHNL